CDDARASARRPRDPCGAELRQRREVLADDDVVRAIGEDAHGGRDRVAELDGSRNERGPDCRRRRGSDRAAVSAARDDDHETGRNGRDDERGDPDAPHRTHRLNLLTSAHSTKARSISYGSLVPTSTGSRSSAVSSVRRCCSRSSFSCFRRAASLRERRTRRVPPSCGSATGTATEPTSGKLCSQIGSWTTTGTTSQPCAAASSHVSARGGARKSERTKTKLPVGRSLRSWPRKTSACSTLSSGAPKPAPVMRSCASHGTSRRPGGSQYGSPSA